MSRVIGITGAGSPIGIELSNQIRKHKDFDLKRLSNTSDSSTSTFIDINNPSTASQALSRTKPQILVHLAHLSLNKFGGDAKSYISQNLNFAKHVVESAIQQECKTLIFASSAAVYGDKHQGFLQESSNLNPMSPYAELKCEIEEYLKLVSSSSSLKATSARIFNVYGSGLNDSLINKLAALHQSNQQHKLEINGPDNYFRDYIHVADVGHAISQLLLATTELPQQINIGTGIPTSNQDLLTSLDQNQLRKIRIRESEFSSSVANNSALTRLISEVKWANPKSFL